MRLHYTEGFVDIIPSALLPLCAYFVHTCLGDCTGISFIDSTSIDVCLNQRIASHEIIADLSECGKTSTGWFYSFKLHLVINDRCELLNVLRTPANVDDRKPVPDLVKKLFGKLFGNKGYISQTPVDLLRQIIGVQMITKLKSNSKNRLPMPLMNRILLRRRAIVESVLDQRKNISQIEHSRHRSVVNFMANLMCGLIAYTN